MAHIENGTMAAMRAEPKGRLDPRALKVWRISRGLFSLAAWIVVAILIGLSFKFAWPWYIGAAAATLAVAITVYCIISPTILMRTWRYEVSEREIDLRYGVFTVTRTLIPMVRVQHVDTEQGPLLRRYHLESVSVYTAAGGHEIPMLSVEEADQLRDNIAELAGIADDV